jgi:hypothetical protein
VNFKKILDLELATTTDKAKAERSRLRWFDDGSGTYRLRVRGLIPLWLVERVGRLQR